MTPLITSHRHEVVQELKRLVRDASVRRESGRCVVEGMRVVADLVAAGAPMDLVLVSPRLEALEGGPALLDALETRASERGGRLLRTTDEVLANVSDTASAQGVIVATRRTVAAGLPSPAGRALLVAWEVQDPGNVGALVRTAEAAGCSAVLLARSPGGASAEAFSPRAIRAAAGSSFRLPVHEHVEDAADFVASLAALGWRRIACVARGGDSPENLDLTGSPALLLGSETRGLPEAIVAGSNALLSIPLEGGVESLNAAAAGAVVAFEAARQRRRAST